MTAIGWVGLGVMGAPMAGHLVAAGHDLVVHSRTQSKAEPLLSAGAQWAATPSAAAADADVVFVMVGFPDDVRAAVLGPDGVLEGARQGAVIVDCTTSEPALAVEIAEVAGARGVGAVDAPVSGGDVGAREARLSVMVGGESSSVAPVRPLLEVFGATVSHLGGPGAGQHTKMVNQTVIASTMVGVTEGLIYARRAGLDPEAVLAAIGGGAAASWSLANLAPRVLAGDLEPGFYVEHFVKDMGIALAESRRMGLDLPGLALAHRLYERLVELGHGRSGTQALILALDELD